jgi:PIN domain nuclease of toxin-antitoxin system
MERSEVVYLDTHAIVHLYLGELGKFTTAAKRLMEKLVLVAPPAGVLELEFLHEIGRLKPTANEVIDALAQDIGLRVCNAQFRDVVQAAIHEGWTRDPFDRLIVANAKVRNATLVTKDENIRLNYKRATW